MCSEQIIQGNQTYSQQIMYKNFCGGALRCFTASVVGNVVYYQSHILDDKFDWSNRYEYGKGKAQKITSIIEPIIGASHIDN